MGSKVQTNAFGAQKRNLLVDQKFYTELKKVYFTGSEMQPGFIRTQKRKIQISRVKKILYFVLKNLLSVVFIRNWNNYSANLF
jgi:hypothetical protein